MIPERVKQFAMKREVQVLLGFGVLVSLGYYLYLKNKNKKGFDAQNYSMPPIEGVPRIIEK